jgi:hypothetical protein
MHVSPLFDTENTLILAAGPDDAVRHCGALIAALCRQGRPPFVIALGDAGADADRAALAACGLAGGRLLIFGIPGELPVDGPVFAAAVRALSFVSWRYDCNLVCAPAPVLPIARAAAAASGLGLIAAEAGGYRLIAPPRRSAREADAP